jgi:hypothetical protein
MREALKTKYSKSKNSLFEDVIPPRFASSLEAFPSALSFSLCFTKKIWVHIWVLKIPQM